jgi:hypothetical protein
MPDPNLIQELASKLLTHSDEKDGFSDIDAMISDRVGCDVVCGRGNE